MIFRFLLLVLILHVSPAVSSELTIYRWIDKNNVVHFSQYQPVGDEYTQFITSNQSKVISRANLVDNEDEVLEKSQPNLPSTINVTEQCKQAKENVSMLMAFDKVQYIDENELKKVLTKEEKQQQLEINQKRAEIYCAPVKDKE